MSFRETRTKEQRIHYGFVDPAGAAYAAWDTTLMAHPRTATARQPSSPKPKYYQRCAATTAGPSPGSMIKNRGSLSRAPFRDGWLWFAGLTGRA